MPYIKQELRLPTIDKMNLDLCAKLLTPMEWAEILENEWLELGLSKEGSEVDDGFINYALTRLALRMDLNWQPHYKVLYTVVLHRTFIQLFLDYGYFGYERFLGLLLSMQSEYKRRDWSARIRAILTEQISYYEMLSGSYEAKKCEENGDVV